jgi:hypothetical protein
LAIDVIAKGGPPGRLPFRPMPRVPRVALLTAAAAVVTALALAGCSSAAAPPRGPKVTVKLSAPTDESRVSASHATVRGTVEPARAHVQVLGQSVSVARNGSFSTQVGLAVGTNLIDVVASAPRSAGAVTAVRVIRFLLVTVPLVDGESPKQAAAGLQALGLNVHTDNSSDPLSFLIPAPVKVCSSSPIAGARIDPGATVTLHTSKICGL